MAGIDFVDTIVVRRTIEKGTKIVEEPIKKLNFAGTEFKKYQREQKKLAGHVGLASEKGTKRILYGEMLETKIPSTKGLAISTGRGTGLRMG